MCIQNFTEIVPAVPDLLWVQEKSIRHGDQYSITDLSQNQWSMTNLAKSMMRDKFFFAQEHVSKYPQQIWSQSDQ